ncbi:MULTISPECIES: DUF309 domain-containing protein [Exiguobacterium]|uniref:Domain of uncharacterized function (DUF309) n=1 Tax=Exiguobacterium aurantiacum TaxID=33987 RepID=A0A377FT19_9BACL|nr:MULTISPECIES: DUF309 domain-containing protein [Exiguobacterium]STO07959.1 Domain of uncharacterised function (DUF309) [Exiguobacterium aurantiacum]
MTTPFIHYTLLFECHADYFECHEVLEEAWQDGNRKQIGYAALIQYAVAHYHARRGNEAGAKKSIEALKRKLALASDELEMLGIDVPRFARDLERWPLPNELPLNEATRTNIECLKPTFGPTDLTFEQLVHKHIYRDRTPVVNERLLAIEQRKKARR